MERNRKHTASSGGGALYVAIALCLLAVGVGSWRLLRQKETGQTAAEAGTRAVSGSALITDAPPKEDVPAKAPALEETAAAPAVSAAPTAASVTPSRSASASALETAPAASPNASDTASDSASGSVSASGKASASTSGTASGSVSDSASSGAKTASETASPSAETLAETAAVSGSALITETTGNTGSTESTGDTRTPSATAEETAMTAPLEGQAVTVFSMTELLYNETMRDWRTHDGIDITAEDGTAVCAAMDGTVSSVTEDPLMGTTVTVRHEGERETVYACLASGVEVEAGDDVTAGQVIGFVGKSATAEASLGPHLHFSVLENGEAVDPSSYLP